MTSHEKETIWWFLGIMAALLFVGILISSTVIASTGRKARYHATPIPAGVHQLAGNAFLVDLDSSATPEAICRDGVDPVQTVRVDAHLRQTYIQCAENQKWNDPRPLSPSWGRGWVDTVNSSVLWILAGCTFALAGFISLPWGRWWRSRKERRAIKATGEQTMRELTKSWALGDISDQVYENKSAELYAMGIKPAE